MLYVYLCLSCKPQAELPYDVYNTQTLRISALQAVDSVEWVFVSESGENSQGEQAAIRLPVGSSKNMEALFVADISGTDPVYPAAEGFTSLDTRMIPRGAYKLCESLIEGCKNRELKADFFAAEYKFLKIVYEHELNRLPPVKRGLIGKARIDQNGIIEVPIRLTGGKGFIYLSVYIVRNGGDNVPEDGFKIEQIIFQDAVK